MASEGLHAASENGLKDVHTRCPRGARVWECHRGRPRLLSHRPAIYGPGLRIANYTGPCILPTAARMASEGLRGGSEGSSIGPWETTA